MGNLNLSLNRLALGSPGSLTGSSLSKCSPGASLFPEETKNWHFEKKIHILCSLLGDDSDFIIFFCIFLVLLKGTMILPGQRNKSQSVGCD